MPSVELLRIADAVIDSVNQDTRMFSAAFNNITPRKVYQTGTAPDELLRKLHCILPENVILAALDIIDCECGELSPDYRVFFIQLEIDSDKIYSFAQLSTIRSLWHNRHI